VRSAKGGSKNKRKVRAVRPHVGRGRIVTVCVLATLVLAGFMWRLVDLQLMPDPAFASGMGTRIVERPIAAPRGEILDRHGRPMALSLPAPTVIAEPRLFSSASVPSTVSILSEVLSTDSSVLARRLDGDGYFAYLERQVDSDVGRSIDALRIPGISTIDEPRREHPNGDCSGIGVVGRVDIDHKGISGLEEQFDEQLTGVNGQVFSEASANGRNTIPGGTQVVDAAQPGETITLTVDRNIQFQAEKLLVDAVEQVSGNLGVIIISDPTTGEIIAMANARRDSTTDVVECTTTNLAAIWSYEPGSVMKPITVASLIEANPSLASELIEVPYSIVRADGAAGKQFQDHWFHEPEMMSLTDIISKSSNIGAILVGEQVGTDTLHSTLVDMGFGRPTALGFKGEASGILNDLDINSLALSNVSIGQGISMSPLQLISAYNSFANEGFKPDPVVVIDDVDTAAGKQVVSETTANAVLSMMEQVVVDGTGTRAAIPGYRVAGKTGTAWEPCTPGLGYLCDGGGRHYVATFAGIVSNDDGPALSAVVVIDDPQRELGAYAGGSVSAPVFSEVVSYALRQLRIAPMGEVGAAQNRVRSEPATQPIVLSATEVTP